MNHPELPASKAKRSLTVLPALSRWLPPVRGSGSIGLDSTRLYRSKESDGSTAIRTPHIGRADSGAEDRQALRRLIRRHGSPAVQEGAKALFRRNDGGG